MPSSSRKESCDSNTPSDSSSRTSVNGALFHRSHTIQSDRAFTSNSSVHTTSEEPFDYTEPNPGGVPSICHRKSFHSLEKPTFRFRNQSQSTIGTILEAGSIRNSTSSTRPWDMSSFEDEEGPLDDLLLEARAREARVLESKVARLASRNYSVEKVAALQEEVDRWLREVTATDASTALLLSSLLLKAILANHFVFSEASKAAKDTERSLRSKVEELELELHKQKDQYNQKVKECLRLQAELNRSVSTPSVSTTSRSSASSHSSRVSSPTSPSNSNIVSSLSRLGFIRS